LAFRCCFRVQIALKLRARRNDLKHEFPARRRCVYIHIQNYEIDTKPAQFVCCVDQISQGTAKPIQSGHTDRADLSPPRECQGVR
jgi:hypothetical protein